MLVAQVLQPFAISTRCLPGLSARQAEAFDAHDAPDPLRADTRVQRRDISAHAVPDQRDRRVRRPEFQQRIEITEIVREPVAIRRPLAAAEAAPVRRHERVPVGHLVHDELEGVARVHPAVQQHDQPVAASRPACHMMAQATDNRLLVDRCAPGLVGLVHSRKPVIEAREHTRRPCRAI